MPQATRACINHNGVDYVIKTIWVGRGPTQWKWISSKWPTAIKSSCSEKREIFEVFWNDSTSKTCICVWERDKCWGVTVTTSEWIPFTNLHAGNHIHSCNIGLRHLLNVWDVKWKGSKVWAVMKTDSKASYVYTAAEFSCQLWTQWWRDTFY